ncbi:hypothetical protein [Paenibacillus radicis (ex Gao et al. 2016)]|uniref:YneQ n=1 Tax=Paenibacillus radicis (ex Gao et al. 2016) TaxID=1737354 RepID=A0A917LSV7_9BACL|nr:hypothetical protein [Paenibacillus radicis (ex Gao et al. 2016)]GGG55895.1 hypothetical protein GCM10010918_06020 [Paenibacillus radicis (ex Gao et al. 2016)]
MAFGIKRAEMNEWKRKVSQGEIAYLTHYWLDPRFPNMKTVTKVGCSDLNKLAAWCRENGLNPRYIHARAEYPHFDLLGPKQKEILKREKLYDQLERFHL